MIELPSYRFAAWKDAHWNSQERHLEKYYALRQYLGDDSVGVELGVYKGGFGEYLRTHCSKLHLVDAWDKIPDLWRNPVIAKRIRESIESVYAEEIIKGTVAVHAELTTVFLALCDSEYFDFIYLDAGHSYSNTYASLHIGYEKLKPCGYYLGDDYNSFPSVKDAVDDFVSEKKLEKAVIISGQFIIRKNKHVRSNI
jgi:hypothetical protein